MYVLIEEYKNWGDYITRTNYDIHKISSSKEKLEEWAKEHITVYDDCDSSNEYIIKKVEEI